METDSKLQELTAWAYDEGALDPVQDWDLLVAASPFQDHYLEFATRPDCPKRSFFLSVLYLMVGDAVRTNYHTLTSQDVEELLLKGLRYPRLQLWVERSRALMAEPASLLYEDWCAGGLAAQDP